jgi:putative SOS response-associated peptidase YedK
MCGRYGHYRSKMDYENALAAAGGLTLDSDRGPPEIPPNYNVSPTQAAWVARSESRKTWLEPVMWGLVPRWAKDPKEGLRPINARSETVATSKLFAPLLKRRRCLVPCDGFYEWKATSDGKQPFVIRLASGEPFFFAGLYDIWHEGDPDQLATFTIITCEPNAIAADIHNRMPVIAQPADYARWLDPDLTDPSAVMDVLKPYPAKEMTAYPISKRVNSPRNNSPELLEPVG